MPPRSLSLVVLLLVKSLKTRKPGLKYLHSTLPPRRRRKKEQNLLQRRQRSQKTIILGGYQGPGGEGSKVLHC
jgi:hypothetical protein